MSARRDGIGRILLLGGGNMGGALLRGWVDSGVAPGAIHLVDPKLGAALAPLAGSGAIRHSVEVPAGPFDVVVVAVKPQVLADAVEPLRAAMDEETLVVSVAAGKTIATLESILGPHAVVRAMPNTPALIGRGITGCFANPAAGAEARAKAEALLSASGAVVWVERESDIDAVTAVSGSGPAYVFHLAEALAAAGEAAGLAPDLALKLARHTVAGAGEMMIRSEETPDGLRRNVTSPNGTTQAALDVLMAPDGLGPLMARAVAAARRRAEELSKDWVPMPSVAAEITYSDFERVDIRVGTIVEAAPFPEARKPAYRLVIDFGPEIGTRKSSAQITVHYAPETLVGRQVVAVVNFPPRQIGPMRSEVLTLGVPDEAGEVVLLSPGHPVPNGGRMF